MSLGKAAAVLGVAATALIHPLAGGAGSSGAADKPLWLVVLATTGSAADALRFSAALGGSQAFVASTSQCANLVPDRWIVTPGAQAGRTAAASAAADWQRRGIADAFAQRCAVRPGAPLALGRASIDPSIAAVPDDAVNWSDEDRVSHGAQLPGGRVLFFQRRYQPDAEDPREGRRTTVWLGPQQGERLVVLASDCEQATYAATRRHVALSCAIETAGDHMLHAVTLYDAAAGHRLARIEHCREPRLSKVALVCMKESVDADNRLALRATRRPLASTDSAPGR